MRLFVLCLVAATLLWPALAQAPGDREDSCGDDDHSYPPEWHVLFDTWNYVNLLDGGPLRALNNDGGFGWTAMSGGSCREQLRICDYEEDTQPQNNWVFTQFISFDEATEIYVNVSYQYSACITNADNGCNTLQTTLYRYERSGANNAARVDPANYLPNEVQVLNQANDQNSALRIASFRPSTTANGFYLGLQDTGTCGSIARITAYYLVCPGSTDDLVTIPEIPRPRMGSTTPITSTASCASDSTGSALQLSCAADGTFVGSPVCLCNPGYEFVSNSATCRACTAPQYKAFLSNSVLCMHCPINTLLPTEAAAPICDCLFSFDRPDDEPDADCTRAPSSPRIQIDRLPSISNTNFEVCWLPTEDRGGRPDFYYNVYALLNGTSEFVRVNDDPIVPEDQSVEDSDTPICYTIRGLMPESSYVVLVVASNGATDDGPTFDDVSAVRDRFIAYFIVTGEEAPTPPPPPPPPALSEGAVVVITLFITAIFTAIITAVIVVVLCHFRNREHYGVSAKKTTVTVAQTNVRGNGTTTELTVEKIEIESNAYDGSPSPIHAGPIRPPPPAIKPSAPPKPGQQPPQTYRYNGK